MSWRRHRRNVPKIVKNMSLWYIHEAAEGHKVRLFCPRLSVGAPFPSYNECWLKSHSCSCFCKLWPSPTYLSPPYSHRPWSVTDWHGGVKILPKFNSVVLFMLQSSPRNQAEASLRSRWHPCLAFPPALSCFPQ